MGKRFLGLFVGPEYGSIGWVDEEGDEKLIKDVGRLFGSRNCPKNIYEDVYHAIKLRDHTGKTDVEIRVFPFDTDGNVNLTQINPKILARFESLKNEKRTLQLESEHLKKTQLSIAGRDLYRDRILRDFDLFKEVRDKIIIPHTEEEQGRRR